MNPVVMNLVLAVFWLFFGVGLLLHEQLSGRLVIALPNGLNPGWLAILFAAFNLFRAWYNWFFRRRRERQLEEDEALRRQWQQSPRSQQPPDPNFQFTDGPEPK